MAGGFRRRNSRAFFLKVVRTFGVVAAAVFPKRIRAIFARRRTPRVKARFIRVFGHATGRPPIRRIVVMRGRLARVFLRTKAQLRRPIRVAAIVAAVFPRKIRAVLARRRRPISPIQLRAGFTGVFGHATGKPPIRRARVVTFGSQAERRRRLSLRTTVSLFSSGGGVAPPAVVSRMIVISSSFGIVRTPP